ncbi:MAG: vitamin K epoxide reductase family protein [Flammeovirgaceae bacterium]
MSANAKWFKQINDQDHSVATVRNFIHQIQVPVTKETIRKSLTENPDYPSLASLSDSLTEWRIENLAVRFDKTAEELGEAILPAIAHLQSDGKDQYVTITSFENLRVKYVHAENGWVHEPFDQFKEKWSGVLLMADPKPTSGERHYKKKRQDEMLSNLRLPVFITSLLLIVGLAVAMGAFTFPAFWQWAPWLLLKGAGIVISILLLIQSIDKDNPFIAKLCNQSEKTSCKNVLASPASTIFGSLSMSEIGSFYFAGGFLTLVFSLSTSLVHEILWLLIGLNLLALPYTIFSIYYQAKVVKQWCPLCLGVQAILWLEFFAGMLFWNEELSFSNSLPFYAIVSWGFLIPLLVWMVFGREFGLSKQLATLNKELTRMKRRPVFFKEALKDGKDVNLEPLSQEVILGNNDAETTLTIFTDPFCGACEAAHKDIDDLLATSADAVKVQIRFHGMPQFDLDKRIDEIRHQFKEADEDTKKMLIDSYGKTEGDWRKVLVDDLASKRQRNYVAQTILALAAAGKIELAERAMSDWYSRKDKQLESVESWMRKYPVSQQEVDAMAKALDEHAEWAKTSQLMGTPTLFLNGKEFNRSLLQIGDVKYYARAMEEEEGTGTQQEEAIDLDSEELNHIEFAIL